jgi:hypothetical protein
VRGSETVSNRLHIEVEWMDLVTVTNEDSLYWYLKDVESLDHEESAGAAYVRQQLLFGAPEMKPNGAHQRKKVEHVMYSKQHTTK